MLEEEVESKAVVDCAEAVGERKEVVVLPPPPLPPPLLLLLAAAAPVPVCCSLRFTAPSSRAMSASACLLALSSMRLLLPMSITSKPLAP